MVGVAQLAEHRVVAPVVEGSSPFTHPILPAPAPVAQLDRAPDFESVGRGFESLRARQNDIKGLSERITPFCFPVFR